MSVKTEDKSAVKQEGEVATPEANEESAPSKKEGVPGGEVDATDSGSDDEGRGGRGDSKLGTITELRKDRRHLRDRVAQLEKLNEELQQRAPKETARPSDSDDSKQVPGLFEDPDKHLAARESNFKQQLIAELALINDNAQALNYIRSKAGITEADEDAFADLMAENGLDLLAEKAPLKAAKLATTLWLQEKGLSGKPPQQKAQAGSVRGSAPAGGEKKITRTQLLDIRSRISRGEKGEKIDADLAEAWAAARVGRIIEE